MGDMQELIEAPLSREDLAARYRALCDDPCYANVPGKIELDVWGRMVMSPASNYHSAVQTALASRLAATGWARVRGSFGGHDCRGTRGRRGVG